MGRAQFAEADFLRAALALAVEHGPAAVTVNSVAARLNAPVGSFYHRFASRDMLLGEVWLATVLAFQADFANALDAGDGLAAALHTPAWSRQHLDSACFLLLYNRGDFMRGAWPESLESRVAAQAQRVEDCVRRFARVHLGGTSAEKLRSAAFVLIDVPLAAVRPHLQRREPPPLFVDELVRASFGAVMAAQGPGATKARARRAPRQARAHVSRRKA